MKENQIKNNDGSLQSKGDSYIERVRKKRSNMKVQVMSLLGWDEFQFAEFQYNMGLDYLNIIAGLETPFVYELSQHNLFWGFWKNHWLRRDVEFLGMSGLLFKSELESFYKDLHDPKAIKYRPQKIIMDAAYDEMTHQVVKSVNIDRQYQSSMQRILDIISKVYDLSSEAIHSKSRAGKLPEARMMFFSTVFDKHPRIKAKVIANYLGMERTAVNHSEKKIRELMQVDPNIREMKKRIANLLDGIEI